MTDYKYHCKFCNRGFVHESRFLSHHCKQKHRYELFQTPEGYKAFLLYQQWIRTKTYSTPKAKAFLHSKFFNTFVNFAKFANKVKIPDIETFVRLMHSKGMPPATWMSDLVYSTYLEHMDHKAPASLHAKITINSLLDLADEANCDVSDVFDYVTPNQVIQLLRRRQLSPWILLISKKFQRFFVSSMSSEERIITEAIIRPQYWTEKFNKQPAEVQQMKKFVEELQL